MVWASSRSSSREWRDQGTVGQISIVTIWPDLIVIDKKEQTKIIIDFAVPADVRVEEEEKLNNGKVPGFEKKRTEDCGNWEM